MLEGKHWIPPILSEFQQRDLKDPCEVAVDDETCAEILPLRIRIRLGKLQTIKPLLSKTLQNKAKWKTKQQKQTKPTKITLFWFLFFVFLVKICYKHFIFIIFIIWI